MAGGSTLGKSLIVWKSDWLKGASEIYNSKNITINYFLLVGSGLFASLLK